MNEVGACRGGSLAGNGNAALKREFFQLFVNGLLRIDLLDLRVFKVLAIFFPLFQLLDRLQLIDR